METRDQWYKPNLLYNIHYRPPKKPEPPKMIVETVQFNPSVCTCGEHGCQPQYRMEKRVLWTNKEACNAKQQSKIKGRETKDEHRGNKFQQIITKQDGKIGSVIESQQMGFKAEDGQKRRYIEGDEGKQIVLKEDMDQTCRLKERDDGQQVGLKEVTDQKCRFIGDGNKFGAARSFQEKMSGDVEYMSSYKDMNAVTENEKVEVQRDGDDDDEKEEENREECEFKNDLYCSDNKDDVCIDEEAINTNYIKENDNGRSGRYKAEGKNSEGAYGENNIGFSNVCKGDEKEDQFEKDHTTGEGNGTNESYSAGDDAEYCSENAILIHDSDEITQSCSLESEDVDLEDVEIASAFGIMTIYCNSELHSWRSFKCEDV